MAARSIGIGLLGCGGIASYYHLPLLVRHARTTVLAIADPSPVAQVRAAAIDGTIAIGSDPQAVIDRPDVDAVVICAPNAQHAELAAAVVAAGKHLYLEKPLALHLEAGRGLAAQGGSARTVSAIGFNMRFHPLHQRAHSLLADGAIGQPVAVRAVLHEPARRARMPAWKKQRATGGGALLDLGSHTFDLLRWHLGSELAHAHATVRSCRSEHDTVWMTAAMASGVEVELSCKLGVTRADVFEVRGTEGVLRVDRYGRRLSVGALSRARSLDRPHVRALRRVTRPAPDPTFALSLAAFLESIEGVRHPDLATLDDGLSSLEAVLGAERVAS